MKIVVEYDPIAGTLTNPSNQAYLGMFLNLDYEEATGAAKGPAIETLVKLKNAGFTADEIVELKRKELI